MGVGVVVGVDVGTGVEVGVNGIGDIVVALEIKDAHEVRKTTGMNTISLIITFSMLQGVYTEFYQEGIDYT
ncbi:hypothetical protein ACFLTX_00105 [Chloroflexota bacterium]